LYLQKQIVVINYPIWSSFKSHRL